MDLIGIKIYQVGTRVQRRLTTFGQCFQCLGARCTTGVGKGPIVGKCNSYGVATGTGHGVNGLRKQVDLIMCHICVYLSFLYFTCGLRRLAGGGIAFSIRRLVTRLNWVREFLHHRRVNFYQRRLYRQLFLLFQVLGNSIFTFVMLVGDLVVGAIRRTTQGR